MLEIDNLRKAYGSVKALDGMSFTVHPGELFGFVGSNGAGKTTCMRTIMGVLAQDSGTVRWNGKELDFDIQKRIGYMPEERGLYPKMKVGEQLIYLARLHGVSQVEAEKAMEMWTDRLDLGHRRDDFVQKLSLGNQQRVQLAAALIGNPEIMVLDEPFSGLDPVAVDVMSDVMKEKVAAGVPVIFSSHQLDLVERLCDRVGIVANGKTIAEGTIDSLRSTDTPEFKIVTSSATPPAVDGLGTVISSTPLDDKFEHIVQTTSTDVEQQLLQSALATGPVHEFGQRRPHLAELFRGVVSNAPDDDEHEEEEKPKKKSLFSFGKGK